MLLRLAVCNQESGLKQYIHLKRQPLKQSFCLKCWRVKIRGMYNLAFWHFMVGFTSYDSHFVAISTSSVKVLKNCLKIEMVENSWSIFPPETIQQWLEAFWNQEGQRPTFPIPKASYRGKWSLNKKVPFSYHCSLKWLQMRIYGLTSGILTMIWITWLWVVPE